MRRWRRRRHLRSWLGFSGFLEEGGVWEVERAVGEGFNYEGDKVLVGVW